MILLDIALNCILRGWYVFPCWPKTKKPMTRHGWKDASVDETRIRAWWQQAPNANVAIACGASNLTVVDCDHGNTNEAEARAWIERTGLPETFTVHTGRRVGKRGTPNEGQTEYAFQLFYSGAMPGSGKFELEGGSGDVQSIGDYVMAYGSIHPDSGEAYAVLVDVPVAPLPDWVRALAPPKRARAGDVVPVDDATADGWKEWLLEYAVHHELELRDYEKREPNGWWLGVVCPWSHESGDAGSPSSTVVGVLDGKLRFKCSHGTCEGAGRNTEAFKRAMWQRHGAFRREPADLTVILSGRAVTV